MNPKKKPAQTAQHSEQSEQDIERNAQPTSLDLYLPITRIDREKREVTLTATAERLDSYETVIGFDGSKDAFNRWRGNIREMHDPKKAVGRALNWTANPDSKEIDVTLRISKGAEDTWQKVLDGTLTGASIGAKNGQWGKKEWQGREVQFLERYDLVEVSLVDNPACPGCDIKIVRADGLASDVLANEAETSEEQPEQTQETEQSEPASKPMHQIRDQALATAKSALSACDCEECTSVSRSLEPSPRDEHQTITEIVRTEVAAALKAQLSPVVSRVNALLARDAQRSDNPDITRRVDGLTTTLNEIHGLVKRINGQPLDGGPVLHGMGVAIDKQLATQSGRANSAGDDASVIQRARELGFTPPSDVDAMIKAAATLVPRR